MVDYNISMSREPKARMFPHILKFRQNRLDGLAGTSKVLQTKQNLGWGEAAGSPPATLSFCGV